MAQENTLSRRNVLMGLGGIASSIGVIGASGNSGDDTERSTASGQERTSTSTKKITDTEEHIEWDKIDRKLENIEENVESKLEEQRQQTGDLHDKYDAFHKSDKNTFADGFFAYDATDTEFRKYSSTNESLSVEENFLNDQTVYESKRGDEHAIRRINVKSPIINTDLLPDLFHEPEITARSAIAVNFDEKLSRKAVEKTQMIKRDAQKSLQEVHKFNQMLSDPYSQLERLEETINSYDDDPERLEKVRDMKSRIQQEGTNLYAIAAELDRLNRIMPHFKPVSAGINAIESPSIIDGDYDFNGDGEITVEDAYTLSHLKEYHGVQKLFKEEFNFTDGDHLSSRDVNAYLENVVDSDQHRSNGRTYRVFYEKGLSESIAGLEQSIMAADLLDGSVEGKPEIVIDEAPVDIEGDDAISVFKNFNSRIDGDQDTDYNILLSNNPGNYNGGDIEGYSEIGVEGETVRGHNAGVIYDPKNKLSEVENGVPIVSTPGSSRVWNTVIHEIRHAQGAEHYEMETRTVEDEPWSVEVADVMYTSEEHSWRAMSEGDDGVYLAAKMFSDFDPVW